MFLHNYLIDRRIPTYLSASWNFELHFPIAAAHTGYSNLGEMQPDNKDVIKDDGLRPTSGIYYTVIPTISKTETYSNMYIKELDPFCFLVQTHTFSS